MIKAWLGVIGFLGMVSLAGAEPADAHRSPGPRASEVDSARVAAMERTLSTFGMVESTLCVGFSDEYLGEPRGVVPEDLRDPAPELLDLMAAEDRRVVPASSCEMGGEGAGVGYYRTDTGERAQMVWAGPGVVEEAGIRIDSGVWHSVLGIRGEGCWFVRGPEGWMAPNCFSLWTA